MLKIALDAGHYINTPGKRTPDGIREWTLNNRVLLGFQNEILKYRGVSVLRTDDATGKNETTLKYRTDKAKGCDVLISFHHNANTGSWGSWGGTETYIYKDRGSEALGNALQKTMLDTLGLRDRKVKVGNMHMNREFAKVSALVEVGFMDSTTDEIIREEKMSTLVGKNMAIAVAKLYELETKDDEEVEVTPIPNPAPIGKFKIGDSVVIKGQLYGNSDASKKGASIKERYTKITRYVPGKKAPYNTTGDLGWLTEGQITHANTKPSTPEKPSQTPSQIKKGDKVKILQTAKSYSTGENIPKSRKGVTYTVQQAATGKSLIRELYSWVNNKDLQKV